MTVIEPFDENTSCKYHRTLVEVVSPRLFNIEEGEYGEILFADLLGVLYETRTFSGDSIHKISFDPSLSCLTDNIWKLADVYNEDASL